MHNSPRQENTHQICSVAAVWMENLPQEQMPQQQNKRKMTATNQTQKMTTTAKKEEKRKKQKGNKLCQRWEKKEQTSPAGGLNWWQASVHCYMLCWKPFLLMDDDGAAAVSAQHPTWPPSCKARARSSVAASAALVNMSACPTSTCWCQSELKLSLASTPLSRCPNVSPLLLIPYLMKVCLSLKFFVTQLFMVLVIGCCLNRRKVSNRLWVWKASNRLWVWKASNRLWVWKASKSLGLAGVWMNTMGLEGV